MSKLKGVKKPTVKENNVITIYGDGGVGKTMLASNCDKVFFLMTEDGTNTIAGKDVDISDLCNNRDDVIDWLTAIKNDEHNYKTIVIDSITSLNNIFEKQILKEENKDNIANCCGGYGKVYEVLKQKHLGFISLCKQISKERNLDVIFLGHSEATNISEPGLETYTRYSIRMHKNINVLYGDETELVGFLRQQKFANADKKLTIGSKRELIVSNSEIAYAKNRFGLEDNILIDKGTNIFNKIKELTGG